MQKDNVNKIQGGLVTDKSAIDQPKNTTRFVLNGVNETDEGDIGFVANEESNEQCYQIPEGYVPLGKVYIGDNKTVIFSVSLDETTSEIGIADDKCNYETHVNTTELNFKIKHQIQATYRLRRGCEDTIYWVDGDNNKPRFYNFSKPENFQTGGNWDANKFELRRSYQSIPLFDKVEVLNSGGQLEPGSYNIAIQYLDEDLNPTEWIVTSPIIYIYNDDTDEDFLDIRGSINSDTDYIDFATTDKSIRVDFTNLDETFLFYRLAFIEATNGSGIVNAVNYTENIPTSKPFFIYTGVNAPTEGTEEEIQAFSDIIDSAETIEQIENRLVLGNTKGKQVNFCKLQKYASRIKTDLRVKEVLVNQISEGNPKNPTVNLEAAGYMPGEIYSLGIVYVFADGSISPVYHIPGKNPTVDNNTVFAPTDDNIYPMDNNNESDSNIYIDNSTCGIDEYWGVDSEGESLKDKPVRHHRFPLRSHVNVPLVEQIDSNAVETQFWQVTFIGNGDISLPCTQEQVDAGECTPLQNAPAFQARVEFEVDGVPGSITVNIDPSGESTPISFEEKSEFFTSNNIVITGIFESVDGAIEDVSTGGLGTDSATGGPSSSAGNTPPDQVNDILYTAEVTEAVFDSEERLFKTYVYGLQFSGIDIPTLDDTNGEEIIGYYIVRNERTENEKTILDSAAMFICLTNSKYISHGLLGTDISSTDRISKRIFGFVNPEFKFHDYKYSEVTDIIQEGEFEIIERKESKARYRDVLDGTSYDPSIHKSGGGKDEDGWSLKVISRDNITEYQENQDFNKVDDDIESIFYLDALQSRDINDDANTVYNIAGDNKVGIIELKEDYDEDLRGKIPYVYLRRDIPDPYSTFRTLPFYKASTNIHDSADDVVSVFGGDTFITPMRYVNTVFWDNRIAERAGRTSAWNYIIGAILIVVGVVLLIFTGGTSSVIIGAGIAVIGGGALFIASGIKRDNLVKAYNEEYDKGLRTTALDSWVNGEYRDMTGSYGGTIRTADTPEDDEIQWIGDCVTDLWFESKVNTLVRNGFAVDTPTFIDAPGRIESGNDGPEDIYEHFGVYKLRDSLLAPFTVLDKHLMDKLVAFDPSRGDSRVYIGHPLGEWYQVNPDYERINRQKIFYHLGIEYDCCSECQEEFPHRVHYSEQSFQEELTDNYRVFLPNNYRDIEGEKGVITNLYRIQNNLYIHTQEALWHLPQNIQERITGEVTSFIGTGEFFSIPPRKIVDTDTASGGTDHNWGTIKTKNGVFFPFEKEKKVYRFTGNELKAISDLNNEKWFKNNMIFNADRQYFETTGREFPYRNNPSNLFGTGFISVYDTNKERVIITKKDFNFSEDIIGNEDYEICVNNGEMVLFEDFNQTIQDYEDDGWEYLGIEGGGTINNIIIDVNPIEVVSRFNSISPFGTLVLNQNNKTIKSIQIKGKKVGNPDFKIRAEIWDLDVNNHPSSLLEVSSESYIVQNLTTDFQWLDFTFSETDYGQNVAILISPFDVIFSTSNNALVTAFDQTGNLSDFPMIRSNDNGSTWDIFEDTSIQMNLELINNSNCQMKFGRTTYVEVEEEREVTTILPNEADIHVFYDTSGSFDAAIPGSRPLDPGDDLGPTLGAIDAAVDDWLVNFAADNPDWNGTLYKYIDSTERWLNYAQVIGTTTYSGQNLATKDIIVISFCNESSTAYHSSTLNNVIEAPTVSFSTDYGNFLTLHGLYNSFLGVHYPVVFSSSDATKEFVVHSLAALKGVSYTPAETSALITNPGMTPTEWNTLVVALLGANPYPDDGLENYGWFLKEDRFKGGGGEVIDSETFQDDINTLLEGAVSVETVTTTVLVPTNEYTYADGVIVDEPISHDKSWTMSFSLRANNWVSWHSYTPNFYFHVLEKFYSWKQGNDFIWKHNRLGHYQTFYGVHYPHIVEYVSLSNPLITRIWDDITLHTEAKRFDSTYQDYVDERFITFNKLIAYNTRQTTGEITLKVKENNDIDYLLYQVQNNTPGTITIDRDERNWFINDLRDVRTNYTLPIFRKDEDSLISEYFIDKVINTDAINMNKDWSQLESLRDKYLVIRLIFDNFDNIRLITNYSSETETQSFR